MSKKPYPVNLSEEIIKMIKENPSERILKLVYDCVINLRKSDAATAKATESESSSYETINRCKLCDYLASDNSNTEHEDVTLSQKSEIMTLINEIDDSWVLKQIIRCIKNLTS